MEADEEVEVKAEEEEALVDRLINRLIEWLVDRHYPWPAT